MLTFVIITSKVVLEYSFHFDLYKEQFFEPLIRITLWRYESKSLKCSNSVYKMSLPSSHCENCYDF